KSDFPGGSAIKPRFCGGSPRNEPRHTPLEAPHTRLGARGGPRTAPSLHRGHGTARAAQRTRTRSSLSSGAEGLACTNPPVRAGFLKSQEAGAEDHLGREGEVRRAEAPIWFL